MTKFGDRAVIVLAGAKVSQFRIAPFANIAEGGTGGVPKAGPSLRSG